VLYWKGVIAKAQGQRVGTLVLHSQAKKCSLNHDLNTSQQPKAQLKISLTKAYQQYSQLKQDCNCRDTWIGQLVELQAQTKRCPKARIWKQLHSWECSWLTAKQVKYVLDKVITHKALTVVNAPDIVSGSCKDYTKKWDLESACLVEARWRFTQASDTPFLTPPLVSIFGKTGSRAKEFNKILAKQLSCCTMGMWAICAQSVNQTCSATSNYAN